MKKPFITTLMMIPLLTLGGCAIRTDDNLENYEQLLNQAIENQDFHTELYIFPKKIDVNKVTAFSSKSRDDLFNGSYLFYLSMRYEQVEFATELDRLDGIVAIFDLPKDVRKAKTIIKDKKTCQYITINKNHCYEYVKYNEEAYEVTYVSNQLFDWSETGIKSSHKLDDIEIQKNLDDGGNSYNMYYYYEGDIGYYVAD